MGSYSVLNYWRSYTHFEVFAVSLILTAILNCRIAEGLRMCYYCNATSNIDCLRNPSNVTDGEISWKGYCTIVRKDYLYMQENSSLISLQRNCDLNPHILDGVDVRDYFRISYRSCKSYLCNVGLGIESLKDIPTDPAWDLYTDEELDTSRGASMKNSWNLCIFSISLITYFTMFAINLNTS